MSYRVELPVFAGPLDLLLHLIKQQEVDIHEVSIAKILEGYLAHLDVLKTLDLADIGDFVVMASTLMEIKSRELLPGEEVSVEEELDPRDDLIRRLLEYKRYRDLSRRLDRMGQQRGRMVSPRLPLPEALRAREPEGPELDLGSVEIWSLTAAFAKLLEETGTDTTMHVDVERRDVRYYTGQVLDRLVGKGEVQFEHLFDRAEGRYGLIGVFSAVLELMKQGLLRAHQQQWDDPILVVFVGPQHLSVDQLLALQHQDASEDAETDVDDAVAGSAPDEANGLGPAASAPPAD